MCPNVWDVGIYGIHDDFLYDSLYCRVGNFTGAKAYIQNNEHFMIRFETFQFVSFVLASSMVLYLTIAYMRWFVDNLKVKRPSMFARYGGPARP